MRLAIIVGGERRPLKKWVHRDVHMWIIEWWKERTKWMEGQTPVSASEHMARGNEGDKWVASMSGKDIALARSRNGWRIEAA